MNKAGSLPRQPFRRFALPFPPVLREHDTILMSGFGWGTSLSLSAARMVDRRKQNRIVLLHEDPESLRNRSMLLDSGFDHYVSTASSCRYVSGCAMLSLAEIQLNLQSKRASESADDQP